MSCTCVTEYRPPELRHEAPFACTLKMKCPPNELSMNGRAHFMVKAQLAKAIRAEACMHVRECLKRIGAVKQVPTRYRIVWNYKGTPPDDDNIVTRCKAIRDGACDAFGIDDKNLRLAGVERVHAKGKPECGYACIIFDNGKEFAPNEEGGTK